MSKQIPAKVVKPSNTTKLAVAIGCIEDYQMFGDGDLKKAIQLIREVKEELTLKEGN